MAVSRDRARGVLFGQAVGDAVGTTQEFSRPNALPFPALNRSPQSDLIGGGPFGLEAGQVTDDTQMAICLADSLIAKGGFDAADVAGRYVEWRRHAFDVGNQTSATLAKVAQGTAPLEAGRAVWEAMGRRPAANGSLMRSSPLGVFFAGDAAALRSAALMDSAITHFDPRCRIACAAFLAAIRRALIDPEAGASEMTAAARDELALAAAAVAAEGATPPELATAAAADLERDLTLAAARDPELSGEVDLYRGQGFVRVAFRLAFWELLHAPDFEAAILDVANRGGDADTNGAIAGALFGARSGEGGIPAAWRSRVEGACQRAGSVWADRYHPRRLFALAP
jgi:ADP-ribosylglycohydrolase